MAAIQHLVFTLSQDALHTTKETETLDICINNHLQLFLSYLKTIIVIIIMVY